MSLKIHKVPSADFGEWCRAEEGDKIAFGRTSLEALSNWLRQFRPDPVASEMKKE